MLFIDEVDKLTHEMKLRRSNIFQYFFFDFLNFVFLDVCILIVLHKVLINFTILKSHFFKCQVNSFFLFLENSLDFYKRRIYKNEEYFSTQMKDKKQKCEITIPVALHTKLKINAASKKITLSGYAVSLLEKALTNETVEKHLQPLIQTHTHEVIAELNK